MKLFVKFLIFVLVVGLAAPFVLKGPDGRPLMEAGDVLPDFSQWISSTKRWFQNADDKVRDVGDDLLSDGSADSDSGGDKTVVYRWRDSRGNWQYSDRPPQDVESERLLIDPDANLMDGDVPVIVDDSDDSATSDPQSGLPSPLTISPNQVDDLVEDAEGVQDLMDERKKALDSY